MSRTHSWPGSLPAHPGDASTSHFIVSTLRSLYACDFTVLSIRRLLRDSTHTIFYRARVQSSVHPHFSFLIELDEPTQRLTLDEYPRAVATHLTREQLEPLILETLGPDTHFSLDISFHAPTTYASLTTSSTPTSTLHLMLSLFLPTPEAFNASLETAKLKTLLAQFPPFGWLTLNAYYLDSAIQADYLKNPLPYLQFQKTFNTQRALDQSGLTACLHFDGAQSTFFPTLLASPPPSALQPAPTPPLTEWEYALLSQFAYQRIPRHYLWGAGHFTIQQLCDRIVQDSLNHPDSYIEPTPIAEILAFSADAAYQTVQNMIFLGGMEHNDTTGFCAYALQDPYGHTTATFRGSESEPTHIDWIDNFLAGITGISIQYPDILDFLRIFIGFGTTVTGHSKGGHNALYASANDARIVGGTAYDAQGFAADALTDAQIELLKRSKTKNCTAETDVVGALLYHPEDQRFVKLKPGTPPTITESHRLENIAFAFEHTVPGTQSITTMAIGWLSRLLSDRIIAETGGAAGLKIPSWIAAILGTLGISVERLIQSAQPMQAAQPAQE